MYRKGQLGREPEANNRGPARPAGSGGPASVPSRPSSASTPPGPGRMRDGVARPAAPAGNRPRPGGPSSGRYGASRSAPLARRPTTMREAQREKLRQQARDFARQYGIPEDVAYQIVRGDFTFKDWMERHQAALVKREKRQAYEMERKQERAHNEGMARQYFLKQKKNAEPMVFVRNDGSHLEGPVTGILPYYFYVGQGREQQQYEKLTMLYCYKKEHEADIQPLLGRRDPAVAALHLEPARDRSVRYQVPEDELRAACEAHRRVTFTMADGLMVSGTIDWFSKYNVKLRVQQDASIILFTHALHHFRTG